MDIYRPLCKILGPPPSDGGSGRTHRWPTARPASRLAAHAPSRLAESIMYTETSLRSDCAVISNSPVADV